MVNPTVEKAAALNRERVPLGQVQPAPAIHLAETESPSAPPAATQAADLHEQCEQHRRRAAALEFELAAREQELSLLRQDLAHCTAALDELRADIDAEYAQAQARGQEDGARAAEEQAQQQLGEQVARWDSTLAGLDAHIERHLQTLRASAGEIALAATARIIGERLADPSHIASAVEHIVQASGLSGPLTVSLAPTHYHELRRAGAVLDLPGAIELRPDPDMRAGGCRVENSELLVDGCFERQLQRLADIVRAGFVQEST